MMSQTHLKPVRKNDEPNDKITGEILNPKIDVNLTCFSADPSNFNKRVDPGGSANSNLEDKNSPFVGLLEESLESR